MVIPLPDFGHVFKMNALIFRLGKFKYVDRIHTIYIRAVLRKLQMCILLIHRSMKVEHFLAYDVQNSQKNATLIIKSSIMTLFLVFQKDNPHSILFNFCVCPVQIHLARDLRVHLPMLS